MLSRVLWRSRCLDWTLKLLVPPQQPRCWHESHLPLGPPPGRTLALGQQALPWCQRPRLCKTFLIL